MTVEEWKIEVANPSPYERTDYVEVDLESLGVDASLGEESLTLIRQYSDNNPEEIPYQIDYVFGRNRGKRILTFLSSNTPSGPTDDYSHVSATFLLKKGGSKDFRTPMGERLLNADFYHDPIDPRKGDQPDGFNTSWDETRKV